MRYIDSSNISLPDGWLDRAEAALAAVELGDEPDHHAPVWKELKAELAGLFNDKCWFCELPVPRSDNAIDHFRPKGRVSDAAQAHAGYRWLAFAPSNFRYSCTFCNSKRRGVGTEGGKADRFPLVDESKRVYVKGSVADERPALLDPCELGDWRLLGCKRENGKPCASSSNPDERSRAEVSISIYHLHHEPTCNLRHRIAVKLLNDVAEAKRLFTESQTDASKERDFKAVAKRIVGLISFKSEFSGDMRFLLGGEREENHTWIQELLET